MKNNIIFGPKKLNLALVFPSIDSQSTSFKRTIWRITEKVYYSVKPRVTFKYNPILIPRGKDLVTDKNTSSVVYIFNVVAKATILVKLLDI